LRHRLSIKLTIPNSNQQKSFARANWHKKLTRTRKKNASLASQRQQQAVQKLRACPTTDTDENAKMQQRQDDIGSFFRLPPQAIFYSSTKRGESD
jgi:hypothetical protein